MKNRKWITIQNNVLCYRHYGQNAVPSDEEWACGRCLCTLTSGTEELQIGLMFHITLCVVFILCVDCCITLGSGATSVCMCCVYCVENITIRNEVF